jgi:hypothetical protein
MFEGGVQLGTSPCRIKLDRQCTRVKGEAIAFVPVLKYKRPWKTGFVVALTQRKQLGAPGRIVS